jgi:hypothetical protein
MRGAAILNPECEDARGAFAFAPGDIQGGQKLHDQGREGGVGKGSAGREGVRASYRHSGSGLEVGERFLTQSAAEAVAGYPLRQKPRTQESLPFLRAAGSVLGTPWWNPTDPQNHE